MFPKIRSGTRSALAPGARLRRYNASRNAAGELDRHFAGDNSFDWICAGVRLIMRPVKTSFTVGVVKGYSIVQEPSRAMVSVFEQRIQQLAVGIVGSQPGPPSIHPGPADRCPDNRQWYRSSRSHRPLRAIGLWRDRTDQAQERGVQLQLRAMAKSFTCHLSYFLVTTELKPSKRPPATHAGTSVRPRRWIGRRSHRLRPRCPPTEYLCRSRHRTSRSVP